MRIGILVLTINLLFGGFIAQACQSSATPVQEKLFRLWDQPIQDDLDTINLMLFSTKTNTRIAAYHAQQAAEKMTKFLILSYGEPLPYNAHSADTLLSLLPKTEPNKAVLLSLADLTVYNTFYRYPIDNKTPIPPSPPLGDAKNWFAKLQAIHDELSNRFICH